MLLSTLRVLCVGSLAAFAAGQDNLGLSGGYTNLQSTDFKGTIVKSSGTLASLNSSRTGFNFLPTDLLSKLAQNGAHHLGDVTFRYRTSSSASWTTVDSATSRKAVTQLASLGSGVLAGADLAPTLGTDRPFKVTREWLSSGSGLALRFNFTNTGSTSLELGSLGLPIAINNIFTNRLATDTQAKCSFADPYIGLDAGFVRVSPLSGTGNALVITPLGASAFEAWRFLKESSGSFGYQGQTYEGNYEWQVHSLAYAQNEWKSTTPWNTATSKTLAAGEVYSVGIKFVLADSIQTIEDAVVKSGVPLAVGIPGYVVPADLTARLYLNHSSAVKTIDATDFTVAGPSTISAGVLYSLTPKSSAWGRSRVTITYADGKKQTVHYHIAKSASSTLADMGNFFTTKAYFTNSADPFQRAPSIMTYDHEAGSIVEQDSRVWIAGLSDEGGTGAYLATAMKEFIQPTAKEVSLFDNFIQDTVVGTLQQNGNFGVVASAFYYEPNAVSYNYNSAFDWTSWTSWDKARAYTTRRAYNYVHPVAAYWSMYRVARNYPEQKLRADWSWYLNRAYNTTQYCLSNRAANCDYGLVGLMGEWVLGELLEDLKREGLTTQVTALETTMRYRANLWETQAVPFGSEMAWDSTGQEGVYYWTNYFKLTNTPTKAINSIFAYMPTVPHWGWNGNARRYWDFNYGAKIAQTERQLHHYGSGLNSLPMLSYYEQHPTDLYALRVGFGGNMAPLSNIHQDGFASAAFHSFPELLKWDPYSGDYGPGFLGLSLGQCVYILSNTKYGDVAFGGNLLSTSGASTISVEPKDAVKRRVFIADLGLKAEISAGIIQKVDFDKSASTVTLTLASAATTDSLQAKSAIVWLKRPTSTTVGYTVSGASASRGGWSVDLSSGKATVKITKA
ncbi:hypothetical protein N0V90_009444 [Kalmusia sp. IMI 367209]|nr:hypothetical protein N0V90_009444 [Kalmusia sp. IMI 367209]